MPEPYDDLDTRLLTHAAAWRESLPAPREPDPVELSRGRSRGWILVAAAAASILAIVLAGLALRNSDKNAAPIGPGEVVPWKALPATHPTLPRRITTTPAAPIPVGTPVCQEGDLQLVDDVSEEGAGGTAYRTYSVTARRACRTQGYPTVVPLSQGAPLDVDVVEADTDNDPDVAEVLVGPDQSVEFTLSWAVSHHCPVVDNTSLRIGLPGRTAVTSGFGKTTCDSESPQTMRVTALHDPRAGEERETSPYDDLEVAGDLDLTFSPGQRARFEVTLTSPHGLDLTPCPDYGIITATGTHEWALNCADVPFRREGRPYLPAGTPVTFAMEAETGDQTTPKFLWVLNDTRKSLGGTLTVPGSE